MHPSVSQILGQAKYGKVNFLLLTLALVLSTGLSNADGELNRERRAAGSSPLGKRINNMVAELGKRPKELYSFGIGESFIKIFWEKPGVYRGYYYLLPGKRSISDQEMEEFLQEEEARESEAQPGSQVKFIHSKDGLEAGKRDPYAFGLGKRGPQDAYSFGMGKRGPQDAYAFGMGKRGPQDAYAFGMGKRGPQEAYSFGMGKRNNYGFGLGKRDPYAFGLGKRDPYAFGLGKRDPYAFGLGKRSSYGFGLGRKRDPYAFGLGKRDPYSFGLGR